MTPLTPLDRAVVADLLGAELVASDGAAIAASIAALRADTVIFREQAELFLATTGDSFEAGRE